MTVVDTKCVALATVFTISWLKAGWCFGFCRSRVFVFLEPNQPSENPSPNHPPFPPSWGENVHRMMHEFQRVNHFPASTELTRRKDLGETCGVFSVGGKLFNIGKFCPKGGWEIKLTSDFLWKDVFCSNFKKDCVNETRIWWNLIRVVLPDLLSISPFKPAYSMTSMTRRTQGPTLGCFYFGSYANQN